MQCYSAHQSRSSFQNQHLIVSIRMGGLNAALACTSCSKSLCKPVIFIPLQDLHTNEYIVAEVVSGNGSLILAESSPGR